MRLLLLSGPLAVGKSTVSEKLISCFSFSAIRTGAFLKVAAEEKGLTVTRRTLQELGDKLDQETDYSWVVDYAATVMDKHSERRLWLFDSVRKARQVEHFRTRFVGAVFHVHLTADDDILRYRFEQRNQLSGHHDTGLDYEEVIKHPNEIAARNLNKGSDLLVDLSSISSEEAVERIISAMDSQGRRQSCG